MPTPTYDLIASNVLSSSASSVTFSSIPATYRDLVLVVEATHSNAGGAGDLRVRINSDTGSNYSGVFMRGNGTTASSFSGSFTYVRLSGYDPESGTRHLAQMSINDYSATDKHKPILVREGSSSLGVSASAFRWASTSAVTSLEIAYQVSTNFNTGSSFYLFGIVS